MKYTREIKIGLRFGIMGGLSLMAWDGFAGVITKPIFNLIPAGNAKMYITQIAPQESAVGSMGRGFISAFLASFVGGVTKITQCSKGRTFNSWII